MDCPLCKKEMSKPTLVDKMTRTDDGSSEPSLICGHCGLGLTEQEMADAEKEKAAITDHIDRLCLQIMEAQKATNILCIRIPKTELKKRLPDINPVARVLVGRLISPI